MAAGEAHKKRKQIKLLFSFVKRSGVVLLFRRFGQKTGLEQPP
jgi:hypothetical protein